jgi:hypothetical protein
MNARPVCFPNHHRVRRAAPGGHAGASEDRYIDETAKSALAEAGAEARFLTRAACGQSNKRRGLALLAKAASKS